MRPVVKLSLSALAVLALISLPSPAAAAFAPSYSISSDLTLTVADLACECSIQVYVEPGSDVFVDLPANGSLKRNPIIFFGADNLAAFTVRQGGNVILSHFTTRGGVGYNAAADRWVRIE